MEFYFKLIAYMYVNKDKKYAKMTWSSLLCDGIVPSLCRFGFHVCYTKHTYSLGLIML